MTDQKMTITLSALADGPDRDAGIRHAFFTRRGGVSRGLFASLNCGFGSGDDPGSVAENRARAAAALDLAPDRLVSCHQVHGTATIAVERPWRREDNPRADGMVTAQPGVALGILAADCAPVLFADPEARVIGAAHGGWRVSPARRSSSTTDISRARRVRRSPLSGGTPARRCSTRPAAPTLARMSISPALPRPRGPPGRPCTARSSRADSSKRWGRAHVSPH